MGKFEVSRGKSGLLNYKELARDREEESAAQGKGRGTFLLFKTSRREEGGNLSLI